MSQIYDTATVANTFEYLRLPLSPTEARPTLVFGRNDLLVARTAGKLIVDERVTELVISGGIGKDTGDLLDRGFRSEADFLNRQLRLYLAEEGILPPHTLLDERATTGGLNARNGLRLLASHPGVSLEQFTAVAHATSLRRLAECARFEAAKQNLQTNTVHRVPTAYAFDPSSARDQKEALTELLILADWPARGWLLEPAPSEAPPTDLVAYARDTGIKTPNRPSPLASTVLSYLPKRLQAKIIAAAAA
jgi:hypothetical protein